VHLQYGATALVQPGDDDDAVARREAMHGSFHRWAHMNPRVWRAF
jgi:hypothetical protein